MTSAGYLTHDAATGRFALPPEHAPALADEGGPFFFGGAYEMLLALGHNLRPADRRLPPRRRRAAGGLRRALLGRDGAVHGRLVRQPPRAGLVAGDARRAGASSRAAPSWPTSAAAAAARSSGWRRRFPASRFVGYDVFAPSIEVARTRAAEAGVDDRVRFEVRDVAEGLPRHFDVITTFDVVHDARDPLGLLRSIREGPRS